MYEYRYLLITYAYIFIPIYLLILFSGFMDSKMTFNPFPVLLVCLSDGVSSPSRRKNVDFTFQLKLHSSYTGYKFL